MNITDKLFDFIKSSPTAYHAVATVSKRLLAEGYTELLEQDEWCLEDGGKYFTVRGGTSLIAFRYREGAEGFMICGSHSDSPSFKIKPSVESLGAYTRLDTEKYGGSILYTWLDRPLSVAGRVAVRTDNGIRAALVNINRDIAVIPSVAIHLNPKINSGLELNPASDMLPLVGTREKSGAFLSLVADSLGVDEKSILSHDLYLYNRQEGTLVGTDGEFLVTPRFDDLGCAFSALEGFLSASGSAAIPVFCIFDNEEIGSTTKQGAGSTLLHDVLLRAARSEEGYMRMLPNSMLLSSDVAHAKHPAHPELSDSGNAPVLNGGVAIKYNANQRYATDAESSAMFKLICERIDVPTQHFAARSDMPCGSTIGPLTSASVPVMTVDIGIAQLAMHSSVETAGTLDLEYMVRALREFYSLSLKRSADGVVIV